MKIRHLVDWVSPVHQGATACLPALGSAFRFALQIARECQCCQADRPAQDDHPNPRGGQASGDVDGNVATCDGAGHHDQRGQPADQTRACEDHDGHKALQAGGDVAHRIALMDRHGGKHAVDRKQDHPHAKAEIARVDVDAELQAQLQPQPVVAVKARHPFDDGFDPGP